MGSGVDVSTAAQAKAQDHLVYEIFAVVPVAVAVEADGVAVDVVLSSRLVVAQQS